MSDRTALLTRAARCRQLAKDVLDTQAEQTLLALATEYEQRAADLLAPAGAIPGNEMVGECGH